MTTTTTTPLLSDYDLYLLGEGNHRRVYEKLGAHLVENEGAVGTHFAVWAPNAREVSVIGAFNDWQRGVHELEPRATSGVWEGFVPDVRNGALYKFAIVSQNGGYHVDKADPCGFAAEIRPHTASKVWDLGRYAWHDDAWMQRRRQTIALEAPMTIYEVHLGSWRRVPEEGNRWLTYRELAPRLADYVHHMGFTHVEISSPSASIPSTAPGAIKRSATSRRRAASAILTTSGFSSTPCTRPASASFSTGSPRIFPPR